MAIRKTELGGQLFDCGGTGGEITRTLLHARGQRRRGGGESPQHSELIRISFEPFLRRNAMAETRGRLRYTSGPPVQGGSAQGQR